MRRKLLLAIVMIASTTFAFSQADYKMMELVYLKPLPGADLEEASKAIAKHNKKYHAEEPFKATVWSNLTGSRVGTWVWVMYPGIWLSCIQHHWSSSSSSIPGTRQCEQTHGQIEI